MRPANSPIQGLRKVLFGYKMVGVSEVDHSCLMQRLRMNGDVHPHFPTFLACTLLLLSGDIIYALEVAD